MGIDATVAVDNIHAPPLITAGPRPLHHHPGKAVKAVLQGKGFPPTWISILATPYCGRQDRLSGAAASCTIRRMGGCFVVWRLRKLTGI